MGEAEAQAHSRLFALEFVDLLEELLLIWPEYCGKRGCPYPTSRVLKRRGSPHAAVLRKSNRFLRIFALFSIGDAGWRIKTFRGY
jgi:hypothetical protein